MDTTQTDGKVITPTAAPGEAGGALVAANPSLPLVVVSRGEEGDSRAPSRLMRIFRVVRFVPLVWLLVATGGIVGLYFQPPGLQKMMAILGLQPGGGTNSPIAVPVQKQPVPSATAPAQRIVVGLGKLLPEGDVTTIAPPFGANDARIASLKVKEGDRVEEGAILAILDNERQLEAAVDAARATVSVREAGLGQARATVLASRDEATAALSHAQSAAQNAASEFDRAEALRKKGFLADAGFDQKRAANDQAQRDVEKAKATLSRYGGENPDAQPDVVVAARNLDAAKADLARAGQDLEKAFVRAPIAGTILTIHVRSGEKPGSLGILNLGNIDRMTVEAEVYQTQIGAVAVGDAVEIKAEALPQPLHGTVTRIGLEVGRQTLTDANPAANTDARVVKVYVGLDEASSKSAQRFTNLQVMTRIAVASQP